MGMTELLQPLSPDNLHRLVTTMLTMQATLTAVAVAIFCYIGDAAADQLRAAKSGKLPRDFIEVEQLVRQIQGVVVRQAATFVVLVLTPAVPVLEAQLYLRRAVDEWTLINIICVVFAGTAWFFIFSLRFRLSE